MLQIISPKPILSEARLRNRKHARERLDKEAEQARIGWKGVLVMAKEMFRKETGLSLTECEKLRMEIRKRIK